MIPTHSVDEISFLIVIADSYLISSYSHTTSSRQLQQQQVPHFLTFVLFFFMLDSDLFSKSGKTLRSFFFNSRIFLLLDLSERLSFMIKLRVIYSLCLNVKSDLLFFTNPSEKLIFSLRKTSLTRIRNYLRREKLRVGRS